MNLTTRAETRIDLPLLGRWTINDVWLTGGMKPQCELLLNVTHDTPEGAASETLDALRQLRGAITREIDRIEATR